MPVCFRNRKQRDAIYSNLISKGIKPRKYFFPLTTDFAYFRKRGEELTKKYGLKTASNISNRILCLPLYPDLEMTDVNRTIRIIKMVAK
jgi:dTDP-4-amino-4,6-dideoxygalactose transaminase